MIGGPLQACIEAQAMAAKTTWDFIQQVGLNTDEKGEKSAINVSFSFMQGGRMVQLNVPLLTIVPIPYIAIHSIDINFKASISASSSSFNENTESTTKGGELGVNASVGFGPFKAKANLKANYSSKKDSKATEESKYSIESTIDVAVKAGQDSMPAGLAKVLEMLGNALDVSDAQGMLEVNALTLKGGEQLIATYKNKNGLYEPKLIIDGNTSLKFQESGDSAVCTLPNEEKEYTITAGERSVTVKVVAAQAEEEKKQDKEA